MICEEWSPVVGWEGLYEVSSLGRVRSLDRTLKHDNGRVSTYKGRNIISHISPMGYRLVGLYKSPRVKMAQVHRLMAEAFIPNPENHPIVRHLNDVRTDNRLENLAWGTYADNAQDAIRNGTFNAGGQHQNPPGSCRRGHKYSNENTYFYGDNRKECKICRKITRTERRKTNE